MLSSWRPTLLMPVVLVLGCGGSAAGPDPSSPSAPSAPGEPAPAVTHGVSAGDARSDGFTVWSRSDRDAVMHVEIVGASPPILRTRRVTAADDFTGVVTVDGLAPATRYQYRVWFGATETAAPGETSVSGWARTAPAPASSEAVRFAWSGDLSGQNTCRDADEGFPIFAHLSARPLDFFVALGDMIYADNLCTETGRYGNRQVPGPAAEAQTLPEFWAYWRYNREDAGFRDFLGQVPIYPIWDDHESINDAGPAHDVGNRAPYQPDQRLLPPARAAFLDYNPVEPNEDRLYRSVRWGKHLELLVLDTRQYRDANSAADTAETPKSMLGAEQRAWLEKALTTSDATWKVVVSSVPLAIPTGGNPPEAGRDGWANHDGDTGFERELLGILGTLRDAGVNRTLWITTDVHFTTAFRYTPFPDAPDFQVHELVVGPLNAGVFPKRDLDETLRPERLFFYGADSPEAITTWADAKRWMTFGDIAIDEAGKLTIEIVNGLGEVVYTTSLEP